MKIFSNKFILSSVIVTIIVLISKVVGLLREILLASIFGTTANLDAFLLVSAVPIVIYYLIGNGVTSSFLPILSNSLIKNDGIEIGNAFTTFSIIFLTAGSLILFVLSQLFAVDIINILAPGFKIEYKNLSIHYFRLFLPIIFFLGIEGVSTAVLQANGRIYIPAFSNLIFNLFMIIPIFIFKKFMNFEFLAWVLFLSYFARMLTCIIGLRFTVYKPSFKFKKSIPFLNKLFKNAPPVIIATVFLQINFFIGKSFASTVGEGAISSINFAEKIVTLITSTVFSSLGFVFFPYITNKYNLGKTAFLKATNKSIQYLLIISMYFSAICFFDSDNIVVLLFKKGAFDEESVKLTAEALRFYSIGLFALLLRDMLKKMSFAMQNTLIPLFGSIFNFIGYFILCLIFSSKYGVAAITIASSVAAIIEFIVTLILLLKKEPLVCTIQLLVNGFVYMGALIIGCLIAKNIKIDFAGSEKTVALIKIIIDSLVILFISVFVSVPLILLNSNKKLVSWKGVS